MGIKGTADRGRSVSLTVPVPLRRKIGKLEYVRGYTLEYKCSARRRRLPDLPGLRSEILISQFTIPESRGGCHDSAHAEPTPASLGWRGVGGCQSPSSRGASAAQAAGRSLPRFAWWLSCRSATRGSSHRDRRPNRTTANNRNPNSRHRSTGVPAVRARERAARLPWSPERPGPIQ